MSRTLLHIYRNTPLGRETLLQSIFFCKSFRLSLTIYIPKHKQFLMYFDQEAVQVDLDSSYLTDAKNAKSNACQILEQNEFQAEFFVPAQFTASTLPDISAGYDFMCCPRSISDLSSKIGLGFIGSRVRKILRLAPFPVLIPSQVYKKWNSISVFFGGSANSIKALELGLSLNRLTNCPLNLFTFGEEGGKDHYQNILKHRNLLSTVEQQISQWMFFSKGCFQDHLQNLSHETLLLLGAYGHGLIKDMMFGSKMETLQSVMPNNMLIVGPDCRNVVL